MAILKGKLMLAGLIWFGPLLTKSTCPHTLIAPFVPGKNSRTRLFPASATRRLPEVSSFMSLTPEKELAEASGAEPVFAVVVTKSDCPRTLVAGPPAASENASTRLSAGDATYSVSPLTDNPAGMGMVDALACCGMPREVKLLCPQTVVAVGLGAVGPSGAAKRRTRELRPSDTYRFPGASNASPLGVSNAAPVTVPPLLAI